MKSNKNKVVIVDFCGTCVNFQSADAYIRYATRNKVNETTEIKRSKRIEYLSKSKITYLLFRLFNYSLTKHMLAKAIKGMTRSCAEDEADNFINDCIVPNIINETMAIIKFYKQEGAYLLLVSAAYDIYLTKFAELYGFDGVVSSSLSSRRGIMTGTIRHDYIGKKKVKAAIRYLNSHFGKNNYDIVLSIGDSITDIPVLDIAKRKIVISKLRQDWVKNNYDEVLYGN